MVYTTQTTGPYDYIKKASNINGYCKKMNRWTGEKRLTLDKWAGEEQLTPNKV